MKQIKLAAVACVLALSSHAETVLFQDNFDTNRSTEWNVFHGSDSGTPDFSVDWAFNYGNTTFTSNSVPYNIPPAPNATGTTLGVKLTVNNNDETAERSAVNLYPKGKTFSGNYAVRFDMWINYNGGPYGGTGSTEFAIFGLNHLGTQVNWAPATAESALLSSDGVWFAVTGEGGAAQDYRSYEGDLFGSTLRYRGLDGGFLDRDGDGDLEEEVVRTQPAGYPFNLLFPSPPQETLGAPGKSWVQVEIRQQNGVITWLMNGYVIAEKFSINGWSEGNVMLGMMDLFTSIANPRVDNFVLFDNLRVVDLGSDAPRPRLTLEITQPALAEPATHGEFAISRSGNTDTALTVNLATGGTAQAGVDYTAVPTTVTLAAGETRKTFPLTVLNDASGEPTETVRVHIVSNPAQYEVFAPMVGTLEITDDNDITNVGVMAVDSVTDEGIRGEGATFSVYRIGDLNIDLVVDVAFTGTATGGSDYTPPFTPLVIPAGSTNVIVRLEALADAVEEGEETVILTVVAGAGYAVAPGQGSATVFIREPGPVLFSDTFDTDSGTAYNLLFGAGNNIQDYRADFFHDYSLLGLSPAPGSAGTTRGLFLTVNKDEGTAGGAASVNVYPKDKSFSGDYLLKFDMYLNFDSSAGGTTEHAIFGVNHSGTFTNRHNTAGSDGVWFAVETDGSASGGRSYVVYMPADRTSIPAFEAKPATQFASIFPAPPFLGAGAPSGAWVDVSVRKENNTITWRINDQVIFQKEITNGQTAGNIMLGHMDTFNSIGSPLNFTLFDNVRVISLRAGSEPASAQITSISRSGTEIVINFTSTGGTPRVVGSETVTGTYNPEANVTLTQGEGDNWQARLPITTSARFFQIQVQ